jgi:hypothetical protein
MATLVYPRETTFRTGKSVRVHPVVYCAAEADRSRRAQTFPRNIAVDRPGLLSDTLFFWGSERENGHMAEWRVRQLHYWTRLHCSMTCVL